MANFAGGQGTGSITIYAAGSNGNVAPVATIAGDNTGLDNPSGIAVDSTGKIYVANRGGGRTSASSITVYPASSNDNVKPIATIEGPNTGLEDPCIAVDSSGKIYAGNANDSITEYAAGSNGDVKPVARIAGLYKGDKTGLSQPNGIALDSTGNIYVVNAFDSDFNVTVYRVGSNGNVRPIANLGGPENGGQGVAVDSSGKIYVSTQFGIDLDYQPGAGGAVVVLSPLSKGEATTVATIYTTPKAGLDAESIALDSKGNIYLATASSGSDNGSINVFAAGHFGNVQPVRTIKGDNTALHFPRAIAVDRSDRIYTCNWFGNHSSYTVYSPGSNGDVAPIASVIGPETKMADARAIGLGFDGNVYVGDYHCGDDKILIYRHDSAGNVKPIGTINGGVPGTYNPAGIAVDSRGRVYVTTRSIKYTSPTALPWPGHDEQYYCVSKQVRDGRTLFYSLPSAKHHMTGTKSGGAILVYSPGANDTTPVAVITGPHTGLDEPRGIAVDSSGYIYVENDGSPGDDHGSVTVYSPTSDGDAAPVSAISGPMTGIHSPHGIALGPPIENQ